MIVRIKYFLLYVCLFLSLCIQGTRLVSAEGSADLGRNGWGRPWLQNQPSFSEAGIPYNTVFGVYALSGETIFLGSSAEGLWVGDITYTTPAGVTTSCGGGTTGRIDNYAEEIAWPLPNGGGYTPCSVVVGAADEGIWMIRMISPNPSSSSNPSPIAFTWAWTQSSTVSHIAAWDITVRDSGGSDKPGRVFTDFLPMNIWSYSLGIDADVYIATDHTYIYHVETNGLEPFRFLYFVNNRGLKDPGTDDPLFRSDASSTVGGTTELQGPQEADTATDVTYKIFFNTPSGDLPTSAPSASGTDWLISAPSPLSVTVPEFFGLEGTTGCGGTFPNGWYFVFDADARGTYEISLDLDNNGFYNDPVDLVLTWVINLGTNNILWNGLDGLGNPMTWLASYGLSMATRGEGLHFAMIDAEANLNGTIITRTNGLNSPDTIIYYDDTALWGAASSASGEDSATGWHLFGVGNGANDFGNENVVDTWTYTPGNTVVATGEACLREADLTMDKTTVTIATGWSNPRVTYTLTVENVWPDTATWARVVDTFTSIFSGADWACTYTMGALSGTSCGSGTGNIDQLVDLALGDQAVFAITWRISTAMSGTVANSGMILTPLDVTDPDDPTRVGAGDNSDVESFYYEVNSAWSVDLRVDMMIVDADTGAVYDPWVEYALVVDNAGPDTATWAVVTNVFDPIFSGVSWTCTYTLGTLSGNACGSGTGNINQWIDLASGDQAVFSVIWRISTAMSGTVTNTWVVIASGDVIDVDDPTYIGAWNNSDSTSFYFTVIPEDPVIGVALALETVIETSPNEYTLTYRVTLENHGNVTLENLIALVDPEELVSGAHILSNFSVTNGSLIGNPLWLWHPATNILWAGQSLLVDEEGYLFVVFDVVVNENVLSYATLTWYGTSPIWTEVNDTSTDGTNTDPNNNDIPDEQVGTETSLSYALVADVSWGWDGDGDWDWDGDGTKKASSTLPPVIPPTPPVLPEEPKKKTPQLLNLSLFKDSVSSRPQNQEETSDAQAQARLVLPTILPKTWAEL